MASSAEQAPGCIGRLCWPPHPPPHLAPDAIHLLPCCIVHNADASVSHFFRPKPTDLDADGITVKQAAFRGRKLLGSRLDVPDEYCGFILEKVPKDANAVGSLVGTSNMNEDIDIWRTKALFHEITYWNHDTMPSSADPVRRCHEWLNLSSAIHKSVSTDEVLAYLQRNSDIISGDTLPSKRKAS